MPEVFLDKAILSDWLDSILTYLSDHYELLIIFAAVVFIIALSIWTIYERLEIRGWKAFIPIYRHYVIFRAVGIHPAVSFLMLIPLLNIPIFVFFLIYLLRAYNRSYFFLIGLAMLPVIFICVLAFGEGNTEHYQPHAQYADDSPSSAGDHYSIKKEAQIKEPPIKEEKHNDGIIHITDLSETEQIPINTRLRKKRRGVIDFVRIPARRARSLRPPTTESIVSKQDSAETHPKPPSGNKQKLLSNKRKRGAMEFTSVPKNRKLPEIKKKEPEKKLVSYGISIDMVKHKPK